MTVTLKGKKLKQGTDYTVKYKNIKKSGIATVLVSGKGAYIGTVTKTFKILPKKTSFTKSVSVNAGEIELSWKKADSAFYYIADERVDFRQLIKVLAEAFRVRIEMKQIGARQEAGRIGGIGPCGRELCCATWMTNFVSVSTSAARYQDISLNPTKVAGQCAKLKC